MVHRNELFKYLYISFYSIIYYAEELQISLSDATNISTDHYCSKLAKTYVLIPISRAFRK